MKRLILYTLSFFVLSIGLAGVANAACSTASVWTVDGGWSYTTTITPVNWTSARIIRTFSDDFIKVYQNSTLIYDEPFTGCDPNEHYTNVNIPLTFQNGVPFNITTVATCPCDCRTPNAKVLYEYTYCTDPVLSVSCSASPNPANANQTVTFSSSASGGTGSYTYSWSGGCTGSSQNCTNSFASSGSYTATITVASGTQSRPTNCSVTVNQPACVANSQKQCYDNDVYWYNSCEVRGGLFQDCGSDSWTNNYQCSGNWLQRQKTTRGCSAASCYETNVWLNHQDCSASGQTCQNNQCASYSNLNVSCSASPNPANANQTVTFSSSASGGTGSYTYSWSGGCTGSSQNCTNSFASSGSYTATITVASGTQTRPVNCSVTISQSCTSHYQRQCYDNDVYWYNSCGNREEIYQSCSGTGTCQSGQCSSPPNYSSLTCYNNDVYSVDQYGRHLYRACDWGYCQNGACVWTFPTTSHSYTNYSYNNCECSSGSCCDGCHYKSSDKSCDSEVQTEYGCPWGSACGSDVGVRTKIRYRFCPGYSGSCTGNWGNWSGLSDWTTVAYCSNTQTCIYGNSTCQASNSCVTQPSPTSYIFRYIKGCYNNSLYWFDSRGDRQDKYRDCSDTNECTQDGCQNGKCQNELKCDGTTCSNGSIGYCDSCSHCGDTICNCGETMSSCNQDCSVMGLAVNILGKRDNEPIQWAKTFGVSAGQGIDFLVVVSNGQDGPINNATISVNLPREVVYKGDLKLEGSSYNGDIRLGINLGTINTKTTKTITFKGEAADNLSVDETNVAASIIASNGSSSDSVRIALSKSGIGASQTAGFLSALRAYLRKPFYVIIAIIIGILILIGLTRIIRGLKK